jgi:hypothetical protein
MNEIFIILAFLFIKHFVVDFYLQTDKMVKEKGIYGAPGGLWHSGQQGLGTFIVLALFINLPLAVLLAFADALIHYHVDWAKMNIGKKYGYTPADKEFWFWLGFDQLAHSLTYIWIGWILA